MICQEKEEEVAGCVSWHTCPAVLRRATTQPLDPFDPTLVHVPLIDTAIKRTNSNAVTANTSCSQ